MTLKISFRDAVLAAIASGAESIEEVANALMVREDIVKRAVGELKDFGLIVEVERGFWIFKRRVLKLTEEGRLRAEEVLERLRRIATEVKSRVSSDARPEELQGIIEPYGPVLPLLFYLGFLDILLLESLLFMPLLAWDLSEFGSDAVIE